MKRLLLILVTWVFIQSPASGQELDLSSYLSNVVDIGNGSFGIITGEVDRKTISFVTIGDKDEDFFSGISVKFFNVRFEATARLVKKFNFGNYTLALYQCEKPVNFIWRPDHYSFMSLNSTSFRTFLDNGKSDNQWSTYREPIAPVQIADGLATLRFGDHALFSRGMPVINQLGSIVGMIATTQDNDDHLLFEALDISIIERLLYEYGKCKYFTLLRHGQTTTLCEIREREQRSSDQQDAKARRRSKSYLFAMAPGIGGGLYIQPSRNDETFFFGWGYSAHMNLVIGPDYGGRFILKPRYARYTLTPSETAYSASAIKPEALRLEFVELPILIEGIMTQFQGENQTLAIGYAPSFLYNSDLRMSVDDREFLRQVYARKSVAHKFIIELSLEYRALKCVAYYNAQFGRWLDRNTEFRYQSHTIRPFTGHQGLTHYFGAEFSWRLWGNWLLKEK
jgi:hypothetical protein